jgi:hypothetical protein
MPDTTTHITTSGGLISAVFIDNIRELDTRQPGTEPESFALPWADPPRSPAALEDDVAAAWELMLERWDVIHDEIRMMDVSQVRSRWLLPLFAVLDFDPVYVRGDVVLDEAGKLRYPLSHRGWENGAAPYLHTVIPSQQLDERQGNGRGVKSKSPHDTLQAFLNASSDDLWAVLSNGILLRVLRKYHHTFTKGYVQFDLEAIFESRNYSDFRALYRMCHASRFVASETAQSGLEVSETSKVLCPLERFYKDSIATGIKVGEDLRGQVRQAIETLGNGFLATSPDLIRRLQSPPQSPPAGGKALCQQFYGEILRVVYRVLFLLFAEQRGMMPGRDSLYAETYAIAALRGRAEGDIHRGTPNSRTNGHADANAYQRADADEHVGSNTNRDALQHIHPDTNKHRQTTTNPGARCTDPALPGAGKVLPKCWGIRMGRDAVDGAVLSGSGVAHADRFHDHQPITWDSRLDLPRSSS